MRAWLDWPSQVPSTSLVSVSPEHACVFAAMFAVAQYTICKIWTFDGQLVHATTAFQCAVGRWLMDWLIMSSPFCAPGVLLLAFL